jgi:dephospho-CoA kinase
VLAFGNKSAEDLIRLNSTLSKEVFHSEEVIREVSSAVPEHVVSALVTQYKAKIRGPWVIVEVIAALLRKNTHARTKNSIYYTPQSENSALTAYD